MSEEGLAIDDSLSLPLNEIEISAVRASGPGGQHVNTVASAIHLRFDVTASSLPEAVKHRLLTSADSRLSDEGVIVIKARSERSQARNRADALERLAAMIREALKPPKPRRKTRPPASSRRKRLDEKRRRGAVKALRGTPQDD